VKSIKTAVVLGAILATLSSANVFAQTATSDSSMGTAPTARQVRKANRAANRALTAKVRAAIAAAKPAIGMEDLVVFSKSGVVTLTGYVDTGAESQQAVAIAKAVPGVQSVRDLTRLEADQGQ
jgi:hyperosmotically inducible periplasmic protein